MPSWPSLERFKLNGVIWCVNVCFYGMRVRMLWVSWYGGVYNLTL